VGEPKHFKVGMWIDYGEC